jgi:hypothetical protein
VRKEDTDKARDDQLGDQPADQRAGQGPEVSPSRSLAPGGGDDAMGASSADGQYRVADTRRPDQGERYRPWFADEPGAPWFVDEGLAE